MTLAYGLISSARASVGIDFGVGEATQIPRVVGMFMRYDTFGDLFGLIAKFPHGTDRVFDPCADEDLCLLIHHHIRRLKWHACIYKNHFVSGINDVVLKA